jgi:hypothetical protein
MTLTASKMWRIADVFSVKTFVFLSFVVPLLIKREGISRNRSHIATDGQSVSQSVSLGVEPHLGLMTRYILLFDNYGLDFVGRPLWREDGSVFCICCWLLPAQSFSGPSPLGLATAFYCLRFETSLFVATYDSQGHGGGIRPRLHTGGRGLVWVLCYDWQSVGQSVLE